MTTIKSAATPAASQPTTLQSLEARLSTAEGQLAELGKKAKTWVSAEISTIEDDGSKAWAWLKDHAVSLLNSGLLTAIGTYLVKHI